ncbi:hypothetical protein ACMDZ0_000733 [Enterococcus hirae]
MDKKQNTSCQLMVLRFLFTGIVAKKTKKNYLLEIPTGVSSSEK